MNIIFVMTWGLTREIIAADYGAFLTQLHDYMNELSGLSQPLGLHSYGELARPELVISTFITNVRHGIFKRSSRI